MKKLGLLLVAFALPFLQSKAIDASTESVKLQWIGVDDALGVLKSAGLYGGVRVVDLENNSITFRKPSAEGVKARELLAVLDVKPPTITVRTVVKRLTPASDSQPAKESLLARPTITTKEGTPAIIEVPELDGTTLRIEFEIKTTEPRP